MKQEDFLHSHRNICQQMIITTEMKNKDYSSASGGDNAFENFEMSNKMGLGPIWSTILVRITDKISRIVSIMKSGKIHVKSESLADACIDAANYFVILAVWFKSQEEEKDQELKSIDTYEGYNE